MDVEDVRLAVYQGFATDGKPPSAEALRVQLHCAAEDVTAALRELAEQRHLVLNAAGDVVMAHPFSAVPLGFAVMGATTLWWGGCAWDSFALPHVLGDAMPQLLLDRRSVLVSTRCPGCGRAHAWDVSREAPPEGQEVAHFLVPAGHMWDDVVHTCGNQRIFCSPDCVEVWLTDTGNVVGYVMDLSTLWALAAHWYDGRLHRGYHRRDPATAVDYLRSVGLTGPFWGQ